MWFGKLNLLLIWDILVLIGGGGECKILWLVVEYVDIWYSFIVGDSYLVKLVVLSMYCLIVG